MAANSTISPALEIAAAEPRWGSRVLPVVRRLGRNPLSLLSILIILGCIVVALFAPWLAPYDYKDQDILARLQAPSREHLLGTDDVGRDILSRIIWGSRVSITVSFGAVAVGVTLGTLIGLCAGYFRGAFDLVSQRLVDFIMSMPALIILLVIVSVAGRGLPTLIIALGLVQSALSTRLARATTLQLSGRQFVDAARVLGCSGPRILFRHILPGLFPPMMVVVSLGMGVAILAESSLSFLGYGVVPPTPSWGAMLSGSSRVYMINNPWMSLWPGVAIAAVVFAFNMLGDSLRDILDPRLRQ
jgi:ABC-type dipeptide/oligopeptide/nickel transport system permease subunit